MKVQIGIIEFMRHVGKVDFEIVVRFDALFVPLVFYVFSGVVEHVPVIER